MPYMGYKTEDWFRACLPYAGVSRVRFQGFCLSLGRGIRRAGTPPAVVVIL